ncbi:serine/threonine-protein kinase [Streptomyces sp. 796.1]|uniref:serine/threonine-protein kinase n=1 Tax=Streptomyces sp. 796.1 TaxID=3163029 RepID=UPI0039C9C544
MEQLERGDPRSVGRCRLLARLGAGAAATVYLGRSRGGRAVAVKVMHPELAHDPEQRDRFRREVAAALAVGGAHTPPVLAADPEAAVPWLVMEFLPSLSLRDAVERFGPLPPAVVRGLAAGLAESLAAVHRADVVHLDVKPANVLLTADGIRLIDFGIAARARATGTAGSRGFMSPEQMAGEAGPPSDVYSFGMTVQFARGPQHTEGPDADEALGTVLAACRRTEAGDRPTAAELVTLLKPLANPDGASASGWLPPAVLAAIEGETNTEVNPPPALGQPGRRLLLVGGAAAVVGGAAIAVDRLVSGQSSQQGARPQGTPPVPSVPHSAGPTGPALLQFVVTGDGPLGSLDYGVNGTFTSLDDVPLAWRKTIEVPRRLGRVDWRLRITAPSSDLDCRVSVDGAEKWHGPQSVSPHVGPTPYSMDASGSVAFWDPSRT